MTVIALPWPDKGLSPNARLHWAQHAKLVQKARSAAFWSARKACTQSVPVDQPLPMTVVFCPPDNRRRDRDNCIAMCKAYMDGIADALQINDRLFEPTYKFGEVVKGGTVEVIL